LSDFPDSKELFFFGIEEDFIRGEYGRINSFFVVVTEEDPKDDSKVGVFLFFTEE
jgi:hypothetical protein